MDFAKSQLSKYGWKEGKGLGANETGMTEALKVKLKFDSAGFGHDRAEEFTFHWWDHVYNKVAGNLEIKKDKAGSVVLQQKEETRISKKRPSVLKKHIVYGNFVKGGTLQGSKIVKKEGSMTSDEDEGERDEDLSLKLSDDELFKICGGRTAHKAARHGLKMTAKLSRVEAQEQLYLQNWGCSEVSSPSIKAEKKKKRKKKQDAVYEESSVTGSSVNNENGDLRTEHEYVQELEDSQTSTTGVNIVKKKKKKKERGSYDKEEKFMNGDFTAEKHGLQEIGNMKSTEVKKEKKKKSKDFGDKKREIPEVNDLTLVQQNFQDLGDSLVQFHSKKNKPKKRKKEQQKKTFNGVEKKIETGDIITGLCTLEEKVTDLAQEQEDESNKSKSKKRKKILEEVMLTFEENVARKKQKRKYKHIEEGFECAVEQGLKAGKDISTNSNQGNNCKDKERYDNGNFLAMQLDKEISLENKRKKKIVENADCTEISGIEQYDTGILIKRSKKEQKADACDEFHKPNENGTMEIKGEKKKQKKILPDLTIVREEECKPVYGFEEVRSDAGGGIKKKKHKKKKSEIAEVND